MLLSLQTEDHASGFRLSGLNSALGCWSEEQPRFAAQTQCCALISSPNESVGRRRYHTQITPGGSKSHLLQTPPAKPQPQETLCCQYFNPASLAPNHTPPQSCFLLRNFVVRYFFKKTKWETL